ncbi:hypothetical protein BgiBS90_000495 [Biomphalaria glabrata]|nr:hypothetical protein BgiBS90_000495 [Biomphalaria glabrata]
MVLDSQGYLANRYRKRPDPPNAEHRSSLPPSSSTKQTSWAQNDTRIPRDPFHRNRLLLPAWNKGNINKLPCVISQSHHTTFNHISVIAPNSSSSVGSLTSAT